MNFLASLVWKDVSLIFSVEYCLNEKEVDLGCLENLGITDYELKKLEKIKENKNKDEEFLENYLKHQCL